MTVAAGTPLSGWDELEKSVQVRSFGKDQQIFAAGESQPFIYILRKGIVKLSYLNENGVEWIKSFVGGGGFFACPNVVLGGGVTDYFAIAIEDTELEQVNYVALQKMAESCPVWQKAIRSLLEEHIIRKDRREHELLTMNPEGRYVAFIIANDKLASRLQMKDIAKYLGITPEALSRIRKRIGEKNLIKDR